MTRKSSIALALSLCATAASADSHSNGNYNWSGFFVGANIGHLSGDTSNNVALPNGPADNLFGGIHGGYRHQMGDWVAGVAIAVPLLAEETSYVLPGFGFLNEVRHKGSVRGSVQLGRAFGRFLPYVTAGGGVAWMEGRETIGAITSPWASATHLIGTLGAGVNVAIDERWSAGIVYNHLWTSSETYNCGPVICGLVGDFSLQGDIISGVLEYRFPAN